MPLLTNKTTFLWDERIVREKSTLLNKLVTFWLGEISDSLGRGRHTTRAVSLYDVHGEEPGFSSWIIVKLSNRQASHVPM